MHGSALCQVCVGSTVAKIAGGFSQVCIMMVLPLMPRETLREHFFTSCLDSRFVIEGLPKNAVGLPIFLFLIIGGPSFKICVLKTECLPKVGILMW